MRTSCEPCTTNMMIKAFNQIVKIIFHITKYISKGQIFAKLCKCTLSIE